MSNSLAVQTANRFREVILNGTWIASTNYKDQLGNLSYEIATTQINSLNTIAILAQHIHYYINGINVVFNRGKLDIKDSYSFDFEPILSQDQWESFLNRFWNDAEEFAAYVEYGTYLRNIDGMIEHSYYHLGQIVLLKKLIACRIL
jgi:hypothetical protein